MQDLETGLNLNKTPNIVLNCLSGLIYRALKQQALEEYHPQGDPDKMGETIKRQKELAAGLRKIRTDFENLMTGVVGIEEPATKRPNNITGQDLLHIYHKAVGANIASNTGVPFDDLNNTEKARLLSNAAGELGL